jgi:hypothetical protein
MHGPTMRGGRMLGLPAQPTIRAQSAILRRFLLPYCNRFRYQNVRGAPGYFIKLRHSRSRFRLAQARR